MEAPRMTLLILLCVVFCSQQRIFGAEVEIRVSPGEYIIICSDCALKSGYTLMWFKNSSHGNQTPFLIKHSDVSHGAHPGYSFVFNLFNNAWNLLIKNVTESNLGLYYCALMNRDGVYHYGSTSTRLVLFEESWREPCEPVSQVTPRVEPSEPSASENGSPGWSCSWQLLVGVSTVCVLLSSLFSSIGVYYLCRKNLKAEVLADRGGSDKRQNPRNDEGVETEVCYSSLDFQNIKKKQKPRSQHSDFSSYSEVRSQRT